jgi:hypothetical protein
MKRPFIKSEATFVWQNKWLRFKGGSMAYTLMISLMLSVLFSAFWLIQSHHQYFLNQMLGEARAIHNLHSGLTLFCISENRETAYWSSSLFDSAVDSAKVLTEPWGLYLLATCEGKSAAYTAQKTVLLGQRPQGHFARSLFLADHRQPLCLVGDTYLGGELSLPAAGFKTATIAARDFTGRTLPEGPIQSSFLKEVQSDITNISLLAANLQFIPPKNSKTYSLRDWEISSPWDTIAFQRNVMGDLLLENCEISGKVMLRSNQKITVDASANLDMTLLFGRDIHVKKGFKGRLQAFASHRITIEEGVELTYPSVLLLIPTEKGKAFISVGENSKITGAIGIEMSQEHTETNVNISPGGHIQGHLWGMQNLQLQGKVDGSVITQKFLLQTAGQVFQNHLLDAKIDVAALPKDFAMPMLQKNALFRRLCWLGEEK